jgi:hypothetical protein
MRFTMAEKQRHNPSSLDSGVEGFKDITALETQ